MSSIQTSKMTQINQQQKILLIHCIHPKFESQTVAKVNLSILQTEIEFFVGQLDIKS
jgi:hypothetical protein